MRAERVGPFGGVSAKLGAALRLFGGLSAARERRPDLPRPELRRAVPAAGDPRRRTPTFAPRPGPARTPRSPTTAPSASPRSAATRPSTTTSSRYEPATYGRFKAFNTGRAAAAGLEAEAVTAPAPRLLGLSVQARTRSFATEILRGPSGVLGNSLPRRPRHRLQARAAIAPGPFGAHVEARVVRGTC